MTNNQKKVAEFMRISGQLVANEPRELTKEEYDFRDTLLREEIRELQYAIVDNNRVEILDALCDIKYVNDGTANMMGVGIDDDWEIENYGFSRRLTNEEKVEISTGLQHEISQLTWNMVIDINSCVFDLAYCFGFTLENFKTALDRVHESNMSKFCLDTKTVERTQEFYKKQGIDTYVEPKEKVTVVYREGDGKVLKSINYHPVYLEDLV